MSRLPGPLLLFAGLLLLVAAYAASGRMRLVTVPDSPSYLEFPLHSLDAALRDQRTPGYPLLLHAVRSTVGLPVLPWIQLGFHLIACLVLAGELWRWGTPPARCSVVALAVAIGCTPWDNIAAVTTDAVAASLGVLTVAALFRWARQGARPLAAVPLVLLISLAILVRPAYLFLIPFSGLAGGLLLAKARQRGRICRTAGLLTLAVAAPIIAWVGLRAIVVGDPALVPFGHQNLAGVTVQLVSTDELLSLDDATGGLASEIVVQQRQYWERGGDWAEGDSAATMTIEARWDNLTWQVIVPASLGLHGDDMLAAHRSLAQLNRQIIARYPGRYARWLALGARRAAWGIAANLVMHPPLLAALLLAIALQCWRALGGTPPRPAYADRGIDALLLVAVIYGALKLALVIATSPPIGRFADAAAILIPAWLLGRFHRP